MKNDKMIFAMALAVSFGMAFGETLQEKIDAAAEGETIVWAGPTGPIEVRGKSLTIDGGEGAVIDGGDTNRCAYLGAEGATNVTLRNFTLRNGRADWGAGAYGGVLIGCTVSDCAASLAGGAYGATLANCTVTGCSATESGAALGGCKATDCLISGNRRNASDSRVAVHGGLLFATELVNCTVRDNVLSFGENAPVKGAVGYQVTMTGGTNVSNVVTVNRQLVYGDLLDGDFSGSALTNVFVDDKPGPPPEPQPPERPAWRADTAYVNIYHRANLAEIGGAAVPTNRKVKVKVEGLPKGLKLVTVSQGSAYRYDLEGVPTETMDGTNRFAVVRVTENKVQTLYRLNFRVLPTSDYEQIAFPDATNGVTYATAKTYWYWSGVTNAPANWKFSGWPSGITYDKLAAAVDGTPQKTGRFTVKAVEKVVGTKYKSVHEAAFTVWPASGSHVEWTNRVGEIVSIMAPEPFVKSAKGMPSGVKFSAQMFIGAPKKAGTFTVRMALADGVASELLWTILPAAEPTFELDLGPFAADPETGKSTIRQGVAYDWRIGVDAAAGAKVSASGLPTGLKVKAVKVGGATVGYAVQGVPTKAGEFFATFKTTLNKVTTVTTAAFTVKPLPAWAQGTFNGGAEQSAEAGGGQITFTVSKVGKLSGKWTSAGENVKFAAASYDRYDEATSNYVASVVVKSGSGVAAGGLTNELTVAEDVGMTATEKNGDVRSSGLAANGRFLAYQNNWKLEPWKSIAKSFAQAEVTVRAVGEFAETGTISLKFGAGGKVTAKGSFPNGYSASGSAVLCPQTMPEGSAFEGVVFVYFQPKSGAPFAKGYSACVRVGWNGSSFYEITANGN